MRYLHDPEGLRLPVRMDSTSNGEFAPVPLDPVAQAARRAALEDATVSARRLGLTRRAYLVGACGAAATLAAFDRVFAAAGHRGGRYAIDLAARYETELAQAAVGGDEFVLLCPHTGLDEARALAERLAAPMVQALAPFVLGGGLRASVSVGCAACEPQDASGADLVRRADAALYRVKRASRAAVA